MDARQALHQFLLSAFKPDDLALLLGNTDRMEVLEAVPPAKVAAPAPWFDDVITQLGRRGLLDMDFFSALEAERPVRADEIRRIAAGFMPAAAAGEPRLPEAHLERLYEAALAAGLDDWEAQFRLLDRLGPDRWQQLHHRNARAHLRATLESLARAPDEALARWTEGAADVAGATEAGRIFGWYVQLLGASAPGSTPTPEPPATDTVGVRDIAEARLGAQVEALLPASWLQAGVTASQGVARVRFVRHDAGRAMLHAAARYQGTGLLVAPGLLLTCWWLARAGHPGGTEADFFAQVGAGSVRFDPQASGASGFLTCRGPVAWEPALNLILIRLEDGPSPPTLTVRRAPLMAGERLSVLQYPLAGDKRVRPRELVDYTLSPTTLSYGAETRVAFAGAGCFDDAWRLVAVQGRVTHGDRSTYNTATRISAFLEALRKGNIVLPPGGDPRAIWAELQAAQPELR